MTAHPQMSQTGTPRRRPADRRRLIIDAAAVAFSDGGYHAVRLDDIADAVGISTPALYRHFPNKYALFAETTAELAIGLRSALDTVPDGGQTSCTHWSTPSRRPHSTIGVAVVCTAGSRDTSNLAMPRWSETSWSINTGASARRLAESDRPSTTPTPISSPRR